MGRGGPRTVRRMWDSLERSLRKTGAQRACFWETRTALAEVRPEADVVLLQALGDHVEAADLDHPFQAVVAVFALEEALVDQLGDIGHLGAAAGEHVGDVLHRRRDAGALVHPLHPASP